MVSFLIFFFRRCNLILFLTVTSKKETVWPQLYLHQNMQTIKKYIWISEKQKTENENLIYFPFLL